MSKFSKSRLGFAAAAALAALSLGSSAHATAVEFYTTGVFAAGTSGGAVTGSPLNGSFVESSSITVGGSTIAYSNNGERNYTILANPSNVDFGNFTLSSSAPLPGDSFNGSSFTLALFQQIPTSGNGGSLVGTVTGSLVQNGSTVNVKFSPTAFNAIGGFVYALQNNGNVPLNYNQTDDIPGTVTQLPLPSTASAGLVALAGLATFGGVKKLRERNAASPVA